MQPGEIARDMMFSGRTSAYRIAEIRPQVSGILMKRQFAEGSDVVKGQTLYQVDPSTYRATFDRAVATAASTGALARRYETLVADSVVSRQQRDDAIAAWRQAQADVQSARINLQRTRVYAPISGRIGRSLTTEGALVTADQATALSTVTQLDPIFVDIQQSSDALLRLRRTVSDKNLKAGQGGNIPVELILEDGKPYDLKGKLAFSEVSVDPGTGMTTLRAIFPNPQHLLLPGMYVRARIQTPSAHGSYLVPQSCVERDTHADPYVYVIDAKGQARQVQVTIDGSQGNAWVITAGLHPGDRVISNGLESVNQGVKVIVDQTAYGAQTNAGGR